MPYKSDTIRLSETQDRRRKLTAAQKSEIASLYHRGVGSLNSLAMEYGVSKKTILLIVNPSSKAKSDRRIKEHWRDYVPDKVEHAAIVREHRHYKHDLFVKGELK